MYLKVLAYLIYKKRCSVRAHFYVKLLHDFSDMIPTHGEWFFGDQKLCQIVAVVQKKVKIESSNGFLWHVRDSVDENYFFKSYDYVSLLLGKEDGLELPITLLSCFTLVFLFSCSKDYSSRKFPIVSRENSNNRTMG